MDIEQFVQSPYGQTVLGIICVAVLGLMLLSAWETSKDEKRNRMQAQKDRAKERSGDLSGEEPLLSMEDLNRIRCPHCGQILDEPPPYEEINK